MSTRKLQFPVSGFTGGLNTEASSLNVLPSELMDGTINIELFRDGSIRRRRGVDFIGANTSSEFMPSVRSDLLTNEPFQESASATQVELTSPDGTLVRKIILDINDTFRIYPITRSALSNIDTPGQTITRASNSHPNQRWTHMQYAESGQRVYFAGRHCHPGYMELDTDNTTMLITYIDVDIRDPSATSTVITLFDKDTPPLVTDAFPSAVAFFAGRLWLSGAATHPNRVFFSQTIAIDSDISSFYQAADPNGADPDILDDDGGEFYVQGGGKILQLLDFGESLFIGATNGIWQVRGQDNIFKANNFSVEKVLDEGINSPESMVSIGEDILVFGESSIWRGRLNDSITSRTVNRAIFTSVTQDKVESLYDSVPRAGKTTGRAIYNKADHKVYYFYNKVVPTFSEQNTYNDAPGYTRNVLVFDTRKVDSATAGIEPKRYIDEAFVEYEFTDTAGGELPYIGTAFVGDDVETVQKVSSESELVTVSGDAVITTENASGLDTVYLVFLQKTISGNNAEIKASFGRLEGNDVAKDWNSDPTVAQSYTSRAISGIQTFGDVRVRKSAPYLFFVFKKVESHILGTDGQDLTLGGCFLRTAWQWADNINNVHYGTQQQIYIPDRFVYAKYDSSDDGFSHVWYKHRARGRGNVLQIIFENDGDKDFHLIGWSQQFYGNVD